MKKRGDISLWFLIEVIAAFLVAYLAVDVSLAYSKGTIFEKLNVAKEISTQINTLNSISGDAYIVNDNLNGYSIKITGNKIEVFNDDSDIIKGIYYFIKLESQNIDFKLKNSIEEPKTIIISKIGNEISIKEKI